MVALRFEVRNARDQSFRNDGGHADILCAPNQTRAAGCFHLESPRQIKENEQGSDWLNGISESPFSYCHRQQRSKAAPVDRCGDDQNFHEYPPASGDMSG